MKQLALISCITVLSSVLHAEPPDPEEREAAVRDSLQQEQSRDSATDIASITADRGIVTRPGRFTIEPSFSYAHSNSTRVAVEGYTVIPALLVGLINISEIQRDVLVSAVSLKYGFTSRFEASVRVPYLEIEEDLREREAFQGTPVDTLRESSGEGLGDVELSLRYQLNDGLEGWPYVIGVLRVKAPTGDGPYDVERQTVFDSQGNPIGVELAERPTGSGYWAYEPGLSFIYPSDPAVLFANLSYVWTQEEDEGPENGGKIDPGDVIRFGFGMGFAFNERTSFSLSYDHSIIQKTSIEQGNDLFDATFDRIQVGTLSFGLSQRLTPNTSLSLSVGVGVTDSAPSTEITIKLPLSL
ncbi:transporter [Marinobacter pelagius]|uniref:Putative MetA-pathway of phenol degradation n=1 Tax=Marinobacter pelagius TaxID=379482 RepID=A0A1I4WYE6_9GAMM|nr:transporter [Marinobacter pelagius]SFN18597.1 Putative MetA-pathway of phenol degradation [Marinobacter pelagius]